MFSRGSGFRVDVEAWKKEFMANAETVLNSAKKAQQLAATYLMDDLIDHSPVGQRDYTATMRSYMARYKDFRPLQYQPGSYKASWQMTFGTFRDVGTDSTQRYSYTGKFIGTDANILRGGLTVKFEDIYIGNTRPYALRLEEGWSSQAPNGVMRVYSLKWSSYVERAAKVHGK